MSPHELTPYRERLDHAIAKLGWRCKEVTREHEREWDYEWLDVAILGPDG